MPYVTFRRAVEEGAEIMAETIGITTAILGLISSVITLYYNNVADNRKRAGQWLGITAVLVALMMASTMFE